MYDNDSHPLLAQVPLAVSPFVSLPTATTLPYTYKALPSSLPPSSTASTAAAQGASTESTRPKYVVSASGHAAHPADIIASCKALDSHLRKMQIDGQHDLDQWQDDMRAAELAEKRKLAPGWLDRSEKILSPTRVEGKDQVQISTSQAKITEQEQEQTFVAQDARDGEELDRAFGSLHT